MQRPGARFEARVERKGEPAGRPRWRLIGNRLGDASRERERELRSGPPAARRRASRRARKVTGNRAVNQYPANRIRAEESQVGAGNPGGDALGDSHFGQLRPPTRPARATPSELPGPFVAARIAAPSRSHADRPGATAAPDSSPKLPPRHQIVVVLSSAGLPNEQHPRARRPTDGPGKRKALRVG